MGKCLAILGSLLLALPVNAEVVVERLTWAGIKLVHQDTTVFLDAVGRDLWNGNAPGGLAPVESSTGRSYALVSHAHNDHFDLSTLQRVLGERGYVIAHESEATYIASRGLRVVPAKLWQPVARGGFIFTAVPAVDGMGDAQVNWVVTVDNKRFFHGGDTLWHGEWSMIGSLFGPFAMSFMPMNGARILRDPMPASAVTLNPVQAIDAAMLLRSETVVPIHYGLNDPPYYLEEENALETFQAEADERGVQTRVMNPGESLSIE